MFPSSQILNTAAAVSLRFGAVLPRRPECKVDRSEVMFHGAISLI